LFVCYTHITYLIRFIIDLDLNFKKITELATKIDFLYTERSERIRNVNI
jgi:hypothetical protein